ncbi:MAG: cyclic nucleotide-binding domain-containing protein [Deferrisomatales bacterium]
MDLTVAPCPVTGLPEEAIAYLAAAGEAVAYHDGELVLRRGDPGGAFYVVLSGEVEVRLSAQKELQLSLRRLGRGEFFGEMSVLTGEPVSADVAAVGPVAVLTYPGELLSRAIGECQVLRERITATLARNLRQLSDEVWLEHHRAETLTLLVETRVGAGPIAADSRPMRRVVERIDELSRGRGPVLITGEAGTGKLFAAARITRESRAGTALLVVVDCRKLAGRDAARYLFGVPPPAGSGANCTAPPHRHGAAAVARSGALVLRHLEALDAPAQEALLGFLTSREGDGADTAGPRVLATSRQSVEALLAGEGVHPGLLERFRPGALALPPLVDRRQDILPLAGLFLRELQGPSAAGFSAGARQALLSRRYRHRNAAELREAVEGAAVLSGGGPVLQEHVLAGPRREAEELEIDASRVPLLSSLLRGRAVSGLRCGGLVLLGVVVLACLVAPDSGPGHLANYLLWGLGVPALAALLLPAGRLFCAVCPLPTAGSLASRLWALGRPPPPWADRHFPWLVAAGVVLAAWAVLAFRLPETPRASGVFLLLLCGGAAAAAIFYQGQAWCRYLCPVGAVGALYAPSAAVRVGADPSICDASCGTHECHRGSGTRPGCPTYHHPLYEDEGHACKLCLACLDLCPHGSATLRLRPPLLHYGGQGDYSGALCLLSLTVFLLAPVLLFGRTTGGMASAGWVPGLVLAAAALATLARVGLPRWLCPDRRAGEQALFRLSLPLAVLAWGPGFASQLGDARLLGLAELRLGGGALGDLTLPAATVSLAVLLKLAAVGTSALCFAIVAARLRARFHRERVPLRRWVWRGLGVTSLVYLGVTLMLLG